MFPELQHILELRKGGGVIRDTVFVENALKI